MAEPLVDAEAPPGPGSFTLNRVLHAVAAFLATAAFVQAQIELAGVAVQWNVALHFDNRDMPQYRAVDVSWIDWRLALVTLPTGLHHLYMATRSVSWWQAFCQRRTSPLRWAEYSVTSTAMTIRIAVLSGVSDVATLALIGVCSIVMIVLGGLHEAQRADPPPNDSSWSLFAASSVLFSAQWGVILAIFQRSTASAADVPNWVVFLMVGLLLFDTAFPAVALYSAYKPVPYARVDLAYTGLSLTIKLFFMQMLLYGYRSYERDA